jgi:hypothetical protein
MIDGFLHFRGGEVFQHLDADDQVVATRQWIENRGLPDIGPDVLADVLEGVFGDIDPEGLHPSIPQGLHQEAHGTSDIHDGSRPNVGDDAIGDPPEELQPFRASLVGPAATVAEIPGIIPGFRG